MNSRVFVAILAVVLLLVMLVVAGAIVLADHLKKRNYTVRREHYGDLAIDTQDADQKLGAAIVAAASANLGKNSVMPLSRAAAVVMHGSARARHSMYAMLEGADGSIVMAAKANPEAAPVLRDLLTALRNYENAIEAKVRLGGARPAGHKETLFSPSSVAQLVDTDEVVTAPSCAQDALSLSGPGSVRRQPIAGKKQ